MPTTITQLFSHVGLTLRGQVPWGQSVNSKTCGFYVVALTDQADKIVCSNNPNFNEDAIKQWINQIKSGGKQILIDKKVADIKSIKERLELFWLPDETILYIGKAGPSKTRTIGKRVQEYYETKLGCNKKHAGGHWVNILTNISTLNVFYSEYTEPDIEEKEEQMIIYFMNNVSSKAKENLFDKVNCFPFANKELHRKSLHKKIRKNHGLRNQTINCR